MNTSGIKRFGGTVADRIVPALFSTVAAGLLVVAGFADLDHLPLGVQRGHILGAGLALMAVGLLLGDRDRGTRRRLRAAHDAARQENERLLEVIQKLAQTDLATLAREQGWITSERISIFLHRNDGFQLVGRYSPNPVLASASRRRYPEDRGCLGDAWENSTSTADLPDATAALESWRAAQQQLGFSQAETEAMRMKSRSYAALRIADHDGRAPFGVVIVESVRANRSAHDPSGFDVDLALNALHQYSPHLQGVLAALCAVYHHDDA